jgi:tetratricopeptide (TPR) repeat protein
MMLKTIAVLVLLTTSALAQPAASKLMAEAKQKQALAERERRAELSEPLWQQTADLYRALVVADTTDDIVRREAALALVKASTRLAMSDFDRTLAKPIAAPTPMAAATPLTVAEQRLLDDIDLYNKMVNNPVQDDVVGMTFRKANVFRRHHRDDEAITLLQDIVDHHRSHETAEYAVNLLLDLYNQAQRFDELVALAQGISNDKDFLRGKDDLKDTVHRIVGIQQRKTVEQVERQATASNDWRLFVVCGDGYVALHKSAAANKMLRDVDEILYNAGVCYTSGRSKLQALEAFRQLRAEFPNSKLSAKSLLRSGHLFAETAMFDKAAAAFEEYARKYAGEANAFDAMLDAIVYRLGTGSIVDAVADAKFLETSFRQAQRDRVPDMQLWIAAQLEERGESDQAVAHLRTFLAETRPSPNDNLRRVAVARSRIGRLLWNQSCPVRLIDGTCKALQPTSKKTTTCEASLHAGSQPFYTIVPRDKRKQIEAVVALQQAAALFEKLPSSPEGAMPHYLLAEGHFETFAIEVAAFANKRGTAASTRELGAMLVNIQRLREQLVGTYQHLLEFKDPEVSLAALLRIGQINQWMASIVFHIPIPTIVRTDDEVRTAYCRTMSEWSEPNDKIALLSFSACADHASVLGVNNEFSRACLRELSIARPLDFPISGELPPNVRADNVILLEPAITTAP